MVLLTLFTYLLFPLGNRGHVFHHCISSALFIKGHRQLFVQLMVDRFRNVSVNLYWKTVMACCHPYTWISGSSTQRPQFLYLNSTWVIGLCETHRTVFGGENID